MNVITEVVYGCITELVYGCITEVVSWCNKWISLCMK